MVGILISFWDGLFSGAIVVLGSVCFFGVCCFAKINIGEQKRGVFSCYACVSLKEDLFKKKPLSPIARRKIPMYVCKQLGLHS